MDKIKLIFKVLDENLGICRLSGDSEVPEWTKKGSFYSITKTSDELSLVCPEKEIPAGIICERGWKGLKIEGPLDFSLVGILASISTLLAEENISIFAISTYETDYILVKEENLEKAIETLSRENEVLR